MAVEVIMPKAGMAMEEGTVVKWLKKEGDKVETGEPLLEILTDKVNMEIEAPASGVLLKILAEDGEVVPVTQIIGYIGEEGEKITDLPDISAKNPEPVKEQEKDENIQDDINQKTSASLGLNGDKVAATPLAKTLAYEKGIDLKTIVGTGRFGEITARDV
jgi:pyruvate dehydrogenase E2 component (dihydrolipoamide acetyltransferase)